MKRFLYLVTAIAWIGAASWMTGTRAADLGDGPEATTIAFYTWFIQNDSDKTYPLRELGIEKYVAKDTIARLRNDYAHGGPPNGVDYFLKVQDYDSHDWLAHMQTQHAVTLGEVAVVPITFGSRDKIHVLAFMKRLDGLWKIIKVDDTWQYR